ncbi:hypothetical protein ASE01_10750 [Nocardioides sp. Root190]|uniref:hypothetical protein n=1 Tax=Nocardioides sp. Root190 TaxID=1736488 RepID=UPI0006F64683|nr:hypothetical protein [Nocardioides sp. Root190]KRB77214.1 hypothetical protein ASE01_10750 [Nocardioides sp. Root190]
MLRYLGTLGFHVAMFKHPGTVHVIRRTDGAVVTTAHFTRPWEMWWEVDWWEKQLRELTAADFCELLQDPTDSSVGAVPAARGEA